MRVFVATVTDENDNFTEVIGVFVDAGLAREACQAHLDGSLEDDTETLEWHDNGNGFYACPDMYLYNIEPHELVCDSEAIG